MSTVAPPDDPVSPDLEQIEHWFVERGVPHFVERKTDGSMLDAWTRASPLLVAAYLLLGLNALDLIDGSLAFNAFTALATVVILIATWALSNRLRGNRTFARPTDIDAPELALFLIGPMIPNVVFGQFGDAIETLVIGVVLLVIIYVWSAYGVGPLLRWAAHRSTRLLGRLGSLVARALPLLLLFNTFLFVNAEVWEVAGTLTGPAYFFVLGIFFVLGSAFSLSRLPGTIRGLNTFESWDEIRERIESTPAAGIDLPSGSHPTDPLRIRQRLNIGLVVFFGQSLQVLLVAATLVAFFVLFGVLAISEETAATWTRLDDVGTIWTFTLSGRELVMSESLLRVAVFLGSFSGMYFTVVLVTDETYREEFSDDIGPEIREALAVRRAYRVAREPVGAR